MIAGTERLATPVPVASEPDNPQKSHKSRASQATACIRVYTGVTTRVLARHSRRSQTDSTDGYD